MEGEFFRVKGLEERAFIRRGGPRYAQRQIFMCRKRFGRWCSRRPAEKSGGLAKRLFFSYAWRRAGEVILSSLIWINRCLYPILLRHAPALAGTKSADYQTAPIILRL